MRRLCFGGTFNPIHHGHLICARSVAEAAGFDKIVLIPSGQPPHKQEVTGQSTADHRFRMCQLAVKSDPLFEVNDLEIRRTGPSYTLDTARQLRTAGWSDIHWLIGADMARYLPHWHQPDKLLAEVQFLLMARPGWDFDWSTMPAEYQNLQRHVVPAPLLDISSTYIRRRVSEGKSIDYMTPPEVVSYIREHGLYQSTHV
jgi:nicotinate-nucleotide adenylyltransferase